MGHIKHTLWLNVLLLFTLNTCLADGGSQKKTGNATRINVGPAYGIYTINYKHARSLRQRMGLLAGFRREFHYDRSFKNYFSFGLDYFLHGVNFKSYYFKPDSIKVYDKSFGYDYALYIHELHLPLQVKFLFKRADNSLYSPYVVAGYHLRYLMSSNLNISQDGIAVKKDAPQMHFSNTLLSDRLNSFVSLGVGWQKNNLASSKGSFFIELNFRYGFSPYYFETPYSASSLTINGVHLAFQMGLKL